MHLKTLTLALWAWMSTSFSFAQSPGDPDLTFDSDGRQVLSVGAANAFSRATVVQPDGKILVAGVASNGLDNDFAVLRFNTNGSLDTSFGEQGKVFTDFLATTDITESIQLDPLNRILVAGSVDTGDGFAFGIARYTPEGTLDTSFGVGGMAFHKIGVTGFCKALVVQADHKPVLGGYALNPVTGTNEFALIRFTDEGDLDPLFGQGGIVMTSAIIGAGVANAMTLQGDGKIVLAGQALNDATFHWEIAIARYHPDGSLDMTWGDEGMLLSGFPQKSFTINTVTLDRDKNVLVAGYLGTAPSNNLYALARFDHHGIPDASFGDQGLVMDTYGAQDNEINSLVLQPDGHILIAGTSLSGNADRFAIARLDPTGQKDPSFGTNGVVIETIGLNDGIEAITLQSDGKLLVTGETFTGTRFDLVVARYETGITTGTHDGQQQAAEIYVYPNPTNDHINVSILSVVQSPLRIQLFDLSGQLVHQYIPNQEIVLDQYHETFQIPDGLPAGIYHLAVFIGTKVRGTNIVIKP